MGFGAAALPGYQARLVEIQAGVAHKFLADKVCQNDRILAKPTNEDRILLTFDVDFGDLLAASDTTGAAHELRRKNAAGIDSIEHGAFLDEEAMRMMRWPTLWRFPAIRWRTFESCKACYLSRRKA